MGRNKRQALTQTPSPSPLSPPVKNLTMDATAEMNAKLDRLCGVIQQIADIDTAVKSLVQDNAKLRAEIAIRDEKIQQLSDHVNRIDQATRSTSLRILGLQVTTQSSPAQVFDAVYKDILEPILEAAKNSGDITPQTSLPPHFLIVNAFAIPAKKNSASSPVIVKLHSEFIRSLVFKHKKATLPTVLDTSSNRVRNKFSIFEDLAPATHAQFRALSEDIRVKSVWSYGGQVRFKCHDSEQVYKAKSLADTFDTIVKPPTAV
jgi:hypothetical protein